MDTNYFGQRLREVRERTGLSLRLVARSIAVSPAYLSDVELGRRPAPRPGFLYLVAPVLDIDVMVLLEWRAISRGHVTLPIDGIGGKTALGLALQSRWEALDEGCSDRLLEVLNGRSDSGSN